MAPMDPRDENIRPALSNHEWAERLDAEEFRRSSLKAGAAILSDTDAADLLSETPTRLEREMERWRREDAAEDLQQGRNLQKVAAIALLDQPFGFTWYDVDVLKNAEAVVTDYLGEITPDLLPSIAHRIACLLPPRREDEYYDESEE